MSAEQVVNEILKQGVLGAVLVWFMVRLEGLLKDNTKALNELKEAVLLLKVKEP